MLNWLTKKLFGKKHIEAIDVDSTEAIFREAHLLFERGDRRSAIAALERYLEIVPTSVYALNNLGICYMEAGDQVRANRAFDLAFSLDDNFAPGVINRAKMFCDQRRSTEALQLIRNLRASHPNFHYFRAVYGGVLFNLGCVEEARHQHLFAWLSFFENLRNANCYLFHSTFDNIDESLMASEHRFWADTLRPTPPIDYGNTDQRSKVTSDVLPMKSDKRVRIAYWSPDFRNHSVRYFARPLIENQDRTDFEVIIIHDSPSIDEHTSHLKSVADFFYVVYELPDQELMKLLLDLDIDVLVELAGHSSHNRINLFSNRLARLQISAIGYPPTSGLRSIDAKVIDRHISTPDDYLYYTEFPLILPSSFWCFDPYEDIPIDINPPARRHGYVTFACVGNISKITASLLECWSKILTKLPEARLELRSISFEDDAAIEKLRAKLSDAGLSIDRISFHRPLGGSDFFASYNEVDIVLDTFPFNGGTTTCFATYMGVPVVSKSGKSLISRMGRSILTNLGLDNLVVETDEDYVRVAIELAGNIDFLEKFRLTCRTSYKSCALGNGKMYAHDFEMAVKNLLKVKLSKELKYENQIPVLPPEEIVRRAYACLEFGNESAAGRIISYAQTHYPRFAGVHLFIGQQIATRDGLIPASEYLERHLQDISLPESIPILITLIRYYLIIGAQDKSLSALKILKNISLDDEFDKRQLALFSLHLEQFPKSSNEVLPVPPGCKKICLLVVCEDDRILSNFSSDLLSRCILPPGWEIQIMKCKPGHRPEAYQLLLNSEPTDLVMIVHPHIKIWRADLFSVLINTLEEADVVGFFGCDRLERIDWRGDEYSRKAAGFCVRCAEDNSFTDLLWLGDGFHEVVGGMAVLDGGLLAFQPEVLKLYPSEPHLDVNHPIYEEVLAHLAFRNGFRLVVHRCLGVLVQDESMSAEQDLPTALITAVNLLEIDPMKYSDSDRLFLSLPLNGMTDALTTMARF